MSTIWRGAQLYGNPSIGTSGKTLIGLWQREVVFRGTDKEPDHFGDDELPRPPGLQRIAKSQRSGSNSAASFGSNPVAYQEFMAEQYDLDRKAKMQVLSQESEDRRRVKFSTCTLQGRALTWWNGYVQTVGIDDDYLTPWTELKEMMTAEYCPRNKVQKMEQELWNLLKIEHYIWGLPERIQENVTSSKPATTHDAIRMAHSLMDQMVHAKAARSNDGNKRKCEDYQGGNNNNRNNNHHQQNRRQEAVRAYAAAPVEGRGYAGNLPLSGGNCYGCGEKGHYKNRCPKRKDHQAEGARERVNVMRNGEPQ
ncbi:putative reverse transcriptase domain-containing protein [Tanacetum coccineum]